MYLGLAVICSTTAVPTLSPGNLGRLEVIEGSSLDITCLAGDENNHILLLLYWNGTEVQAMGPPKRTINATARAVIYQLGLVARSDNGSELNCQDHSKPPSDPDRTSNTVTLIVSCRL